MSGEHYTPVIHQTTERRGLFNPAEAREGRRTAVFVVVPRGFRPESRHNVGGPVLDERLAKLGVALDRSLGSPGNLAPGEGAEKELDNFIAHRHKQRVTNEGERAEEVGGVYGALLEMCFSTVRLRAPRSGCGSSVAPPTKSLAAAGHMG